jgi:superfamily II DNA or RNA helicase
MGIVDIDTRSMDSYRQFMRIKRLPTYEIRGTQAIIPDEYMHMLGQSAESRDGLPFQPINGLFDYQRDIAEIAVRKRKYAGFIDCGFGKTLILLEHAKHALQSLPASKCYLIVSPLMVIPQTAAEADRWYGDELNIEHIPAAKIQEWLISGKGRIGITNYEALANIENRGRLGGIGLDESSMLKSHYGKHGLKCIELGAGLAWKIALTGTPAPNDRIEFGNHAVFLDQFRSTNEFLAKYFVNRGETGERWEMKPHAIKSFYRDLSHWCIFMSNPATYGWKDNCGTIPPIRVHIDEVELTAGQRKAVQDMTGQLMVTNVGGIGTRGKLARIGKGIGPQGDVETLKPQFIKSLVEREPERSTIMWCKYNPEQDAMAKLFPHAANISGDTPYDDRIEQIGMFKAQQTNLLISKPKILGFGLNLQVATRQIFSSLQDSYEEFYQAVKRSNRVGSTETLDVHVPVTEVEMPMVQTVLDKAHRIEQDTREQEELFKECGIGR